MALLGKQGWRLMSNPNSLVARHYKAKYYPWCDFMHAPKGSNSSFVWQSIHDARLVLKEGCRWMIGDGSKINIFRELWTTNRQALKEEDANFFNPFLRVAYILVAGTKEWNGEVINQWFPLIVADQICRSPLFSTIDDVDQLIWWREQSGSYSVRSAYKLLMERV